MSGDGSFEQASASSVPVGGLVHVSGQFDLGADEKRVWQGRSDERIKLAVMTALHWDLAVPRGRVQVSVHQGRVILTGRVARDSERSRAEVDALAVNGVTDVMNKIELREGD